MKEKQIKVLMVEPGKIPEIVFLQNELTALQEAVSIGSDYRGYIEIVELDENSCILCNEEGKLIGLAPNRRLEGDILCGTFYVVGQNEEGELCSLDDDMLEQYLWQFYYPEEISQEEAENAIFACFFDL